MVAQIDKKYIQTRPSRLWSRMLSYILFEGRPLTTRGQWINPLIFMHLAIARKLPQLKKVKDPIFILGAGRSGTTILGVLMSMHSKVGFLNEPKAMWHAALGGGEDLIGSYSRDPAFYRLDKKQASDSVQKSMHRHYGSYLAATFSQRVVDKYPELVFRVPFVQKIFPGAKFLFIARNGWDTCGSIKLWSERLGKEHKNETHDWWGANDRKWQLLVSQIVPEHPDLAPYVDDMKSWADQEQRAIVEWIVTMREGLAQSARFPNHVLHIPYESLCSSPQEWMKKISHFVDLPEDDIFISYAGMKLQSVPPKKPFSLEPCLEEPFAVTMQLLGYAKTTT